MSAQSTWVEVALNGPWGRELQPRAPIAVDAIVEEGIAAAHAGAAVVHFHAYDEASGRQKDDWQLYARIIEGIRSRVDVIAYPTIPLAGSGLGSYEPTAAADRFRHVEELGRRGLIEWAVCDPGTVNFSRFDRMADGDPGFVYLNPGEHIREGLRIAAAHQIRPSFAIYEPGFSRLGAAFVAVTRNVLTPVYRLMFSDEFAWGFPPKPYALEAHLALLAEVAPDAPWMIAGLGVSVDGLMEETIARGGHLRVGLEDAHFGTDRSNALLVEEAVRVVTATGRKAATAVEIREALAVVDRKQSRSKQS
jgi:3-keto-5-aminohexanoate cleavage enzyme